MFDFGNLILTSFNIYTTGRDIERIVAVLLKVDDWETLANWLEINYYSIKTDCEINSGRASCFRRRVVQTYCDRQLSDLETIAGNIAHILKNEMGKWKQGKELEDLTFGLIGELRVLYE